MDVFSQEFDFDSDHDTETTSEAKEDDHLLLQAENRGLSEDEEEIIYTQKQTTKDFDLTESDEEPKTKIRKFDEFLMPKNPSKSGAGSSGSGLKNATIRDLRDDKDSDQPGTSTQRQRKCVIASKTIDDLLTQELEAEFFQLSQFASQNKSLESGEEIGDIFADTTEHFNGIGDLFKTKDDSSTTQIEIRAINDLFGQMDTQDFASLSKLTQEASSNTLNYTEVMPNVLNYSTIAVADDSKSTYTTIFIYEIIANVLINRPHQRVLFVNVFDVFDPKVCARVVKKHCKKVNACTEHQLSRLDVKRVLNERDWKLFMSKINELPTYSLLVIDSLRFYYYNDYGKKDFGRPVKRKDYAQRYIKIFHALAMSKGITTLISLPFHLIKSDAELFGGPSLKKKPTRKQYYKTNEQNEEEIGAGLTIFLSRINKKVLRMKIKGNNYGEAEEFYYHLLANGLEWKKDEKAEKN